ncbi:hypothetical protein F4679DRAFT_577937 [Xylaria curta]|nr:hypothetical protein F4679DRAFT_577937 [Xylaria curta]
MDKYLQDHGLTSVQYFDQTVRNVLKGEGKISKKRWLTLYMLQACVLIITSLSTNNIISDIVTTISGVAIVPGTGTIGLLVLVGVKSGPIGCAALGTVATIAGTIGNREPLSLSSSNAINDLFHKRQEVYVQLRTLQVYSSWIARFELFFLDEDLAKSPDNFAKQYQSVFQQEANQTKGKPVAEELVQLDQYRHAWTNEDPNLSFNSMMRMTTEPRQFILTDQEDNRHSFDARIATQDSHNAREQCVIEDINTKESWIMKAEVSVDQKDQQTVALHLSKVGDTAVVLEGCKLSFPSL